MYSTEWKVRFGDIDQAKTLYYPRLFDNMHRAFETMMDDLDLPLPDVVEDLGIALPIVEVDASYHAPIRYGDLVTVEIEPTLGDSSVQLQYRGTRDGDQQLFEMTETRVVIDASSFDEFQSVSIPDRFRDTLERAATE